MTVLPRVEDLPQVVLAEDRKEEEVSHLVCCDWRLIIGRGERLYALCGADVTNEGATDEYTGVGCTVCTVLENQSPSGCNPRTGNCLDCPQDLFNPK